MLEAATPPEIFREALAPLLLAAATCGADISKLQFLDAPKEYAVDAATQDLNALWCATCPKPLHNPGAGAVVQAQLWYRDPLNTSNQTTSLSDAIEFCIEP